MGFSILYVYCTGAMWSVSSSMLVVACSVEAVTVSMCDFSAYVWAVAISMYVVAGSM